MNIVFVPYLKFGRKIRQYNLNKQPYYKKDFFVKKSIFCSTIEIICIFARSKFEKTYNIHYQIN